MQSTIMAVIILFQSTITPLIDLLCIINLTSLAQHKLMRFGYLYPLESESILTSQNLHILINAPSA